MQNLGSAIHSKTSGNISSCNRLVLDSSRARFSSPSFALSLISVAKKLACLKNAVLVSALLENRDVLTVEDFLACVGEVLANLFNATHFIHDNIDQTAKLAIVNIMIFGDCWHL